MDPSSIDDELPRSTGRVARGRPAIAASIVSRSLKTGIRMLSVRAMRRFCPKVAGVAGLDLSPVKTFNGHRRTALGLALGVPISIVLGVLAFRGTDPAEVADVLRAADPWRIALAVGAFGVMYTLQAARWRVVARTPSVPLRTLGGMVVGGIAVNNVLPGRIGDVLRARWLGLRARLTFGRALATVVLDRAGDVIALTVLLGASV